MPEDKDKSEKNIISDLMNQIAGTGEDKKSSSFPVTMVLVGILVLVLAVFGIRMAMAKRKAAKLAYKIRKIEEEKERARENEKLAENSTARMTAKEEVKALGKEILQLKANMAMRMSDHKAEVEKLQAVTSWDDIVVVDARDE